MIKGVAEWAIPFSFNLFTRMKKLLPEITIIRPLIIFLLVVYHCLCVFTGGWVQPQGVEKIGAYWWLGKLISGFRIECIAFVGGYVMAYQFIERGKDQKFIPFLWKKVKRLLLPCVIFGLAFWMLFRFDGTWHWKSMCYRLIGGVSHLWFLPMLFWNFMLMWLIAKWLQPEKRPWLAGALLVGLAVLSMLPNPRWYFGTSQVNHFLFYFYAGYVLWCYVPKILPKLNLRVAAGLLFALYAALLLLRIKVAIPAHWSPWGIRMMRWGHICCGIGALYCFVMDFLRRTPDYQPRPWLLWSNNVCYGVYVFHMFFLQWLYYKSALPAMINSWLLPWVALVVTMAGSLAVAAIFKKLKINII